MRSHLVRSTLAAALLTAIPALAQAQRSAAATSGIALTPYAGLAVFGDLSAASFGGIGLSTSTGTVYGAQVAIPFSSRVALVGNAAYGSGDISMGVPLLGGVTLGSTSLVLADVDVEVGLTEPGQLAGGVRPFVQAGGGVMRRKLSGFGYSAEATDPAFNVGAGADLQLARGLGLRLMAKDYVGKFDLKEATSIPLQTSTTHNWMLTAGLKLGL